MARRRLFFKIGSTAIVLGLLIFFIMSRPLRLLRAQIFASLRPMIRSAFFIRSWGDNVFSGGNAGNLMSGERLEQLSVATALTQDLKGENDRLRSALNFKEKNKLNLQGTAVLFYGRELGKEFLLIDLGSKEGIEKGNLVIDAYGSLIGSVKEVEDSFAKVGIASNPEEVYEVELLPSGIHAFAKGLGSRGFSLELLPQDAIIRKGDFVAMKGDRRSLVLGEVVRISSSGTGAFKEVRAVLLAHPESQHEVFVIK